MFDSIAVAVKVVIGGELLFAVLVGAGEEAFASGRFGSQFFSTEMLC
jgi:hypothetical protein